MDNDVYINFFYKLVKDLQIEEKTIISKFLKNKKIDEKYISKLFFDEEIFICEVKLENERILLIEDFGINFLLSHSILIGDKTELIEFLFEGKKEIYVADKKLIEIIKKQFDIKIMKEIKPRELFNKKYEFGFKQPKIMKNLKEYLNVIKKLNFNKLHINRSDKVSNFLPTIKSSHFKLACVMNLPLISLIDENYIRESIINIYDNNKIKEIIKPLMSYSKKIEFDVLKKNKLKVYKDISRQYFISFDKEKIIYKILECNKINFDKNKIINEIKNFEDVEISSNHGKYAIPLWKSKGEGDFLQIKDTYDFRDLTGVNFEINSEMFSDLYLQSLCGRKAIYKKSYLKKEFVDLFENLDPSNIIRFNNVKELVLQLIFKDEIDEIWFNEKIDAGKINNLKKTSAKLLNIIVKICVESNKMPEKLENNDIYNSYFEAINSKINNIFIDYKKHNSKNKLLIEIDEICIKLRNILKLNIVEQIYTYTISNLLLELIKIIKEFDKEHAQNLENEFKSYFKDFEKANYDVKENKKIIHLIDDLILSKKLSRKKDVFIIIKDNNIDEKLFENMKIFDDKELEYIECIKPNIWKLKKIFKYSWKELSDLIRKVEISHIKNGERIIFDVKGKKIILTNDFYMLFKKYNGYRQIAENDYFKILV